MNNRSGISLLICIFTFIQVSFSLEQSGGSLVHLATHLDRPADAVSGLAWSDVKDFCSKANYTVTEAVAYGEYMRRVRKVPLGFQGAPYVPVAPWSCEKRGTKFAEEVIERLPGPMEIAADQSLRHNVSFNGQAPINQYGIQFHNGAVITNFRFYYVWYGIWPVGNKSPSDSTTVKILEDLALNLFQSCWWGTTATYTDRNRTPVTLRPSFAGSVFVNSISPCFQGKTMTSAKVYSVTSCLINNKLVAPSSSTMYLMLGSRDIYYAGFCQTWCGWHYFTSYNPPGHLVGYVGSVSPNCTRCGAQSPSPNNNIEADRMANIIVHELTETATDPYVDAWYQTGGKGYENADICAWQYGSTKPTPPPGSGVYNMYLKCPLGTPNCVSRYWLLQMNWANVAPSGSCTRGAISGICPAGTLP
eukprot:jgi/Botrbrau1/6394/Bobra.49_1s0012.1